MCFVGSVPVDTQFFPYDRQELVAAVGRIVIERPYHDTAEILFHNVFTFLPYKFPAVPVSPATLIEIRDIRDGSLILVKDLGE